MKKMVCFLGLLLLLFSAIVHGEEGWKSNKYQWESLLPDKDNILKITGGDLNGDLKDDIVAVYNARSQNILVALLSKGETYTKVPYDLLSSDVIGKNELAKVDKLVIQNNLVVMTLKFDINKLIKDLSGEKLTVLKMKYAEDKIKLTEFISTGTVSGGRLAHVFYNVQEGRIYYRYLAEDQKVGEPNHYYYRHYSRVVAPKLSKPLPVDGDVNKWVLMARPQMLKNCTDGYPITYGFERWTSDDDLSGKYYMAYTPSHIFFLVEVNDDTYRQNFSGDKSLRGDHLEIWFANDSTKYQLGLNPGNFANIAPEALMWFKNLSPQANTKLNDVEMKSKKTDNGYIVEAKIPISTLGLQNIKDISKFTIVLSDSDTSDRQEKIMASSSLTWSDEWSLGEVVWK